MTSTGDQTPDVLLFRLAESAYHTTLTKDSKDYGRIIQVVTIVVTYPHDTYPYQHHSPPPLGSRQAKDGEHKVSYILHIEVSLTLSEWYISTEYGSLYLFNYHMY